MSSFDCYWTFFEMWISCHSCVMNVPIMFSNSWNYFFSGIKDTSSSHLTLPCQNSIFMLDLDNICKDKILCTMLNKILNAMTRDTVHYLENMCHDEIYMYIIKWVSTTQLLGSDNKFYKICICKMEGTLLFECYPNVLDILTAKLMTWRIMQRFKLRKSSQTQKWTHFIST